MRDQRFAHPVGPDSLISIGLCLFWDATMCAWCLDCLQTSLSSGRMTVCMSGHSPHQDGSACCREEL
jgi:hypothetical protein